MPLSSEDKEFAQYVVDLMQSIGPVNAKRMFGGYGVFLDGLMFALIADGLLYFKVDKENQSQFIENDLPPFTYFKKDKECKMSYYLSPEDALEDADIMNTWGNAAYAAALRAAAQKK